MRTPYIVYADITNVVLFTPERLLKVPRLALNCEGASQFQVETGPFLKAYHASLTTANSWRMCVVLRGKCSSDSSCCAAFIRTNIMIIILEITSTCFIYFAPHFSSQLVGRIISLHDVSCLSQNEGEHKLRLSLRFSPHYLNPLLVISVISL